MPREQGIHEIEVHVSCLCLEKREGKLHFLIGKRSSNRQLFPNLWECGGGQVNTNETFPKAVMRQMHEEFGLDVDVLFPYRDYAINAEGKIIPGVGFVCVPNSKQDVKIDNIELIDFKWVTQDSISNYDMIEGIPADVAKGIEMYEKLNRP